MKSPYTNCRECPLIDQPMIIGETTCGEDLSKTEVLILAEAPAGAEVKKGRPLVGSSGKIFRKAFITSKLNTVPYTISNVVLCSNLQMVNGRMKTFNPPKEAILCCRSNWEKLIEITAPKFIFIMGGTSMGVFGFGETGILKLNGNYFDYKGTPVLLTVHPSYILQNGGLNTEVGKKFVSDMDGLYNKIMGNKPTINIKGLKSLTKPHHYKYPEWLFGDDVSLIDVQRYQDRNEVNFIFRDKNGIKKYHSVPDSKYYYYTYDVPLGSSPMTTMIDTVSLVVGEPSSSKEVGHYESDVRTELKHSIDYYYQRNERQVPEANIPIKTMYFDIEVYNQGYKGFPDPRKALRPICAISFKIMGGITNVWIAKLKNMDSSGIDVGKKFKVKFFENEGKLLSAFCKKVIEEDPSLLTGWNIAGFDIPTILGRMKNHHIPLQNISPIRKVYYNNRRYGDFYIGGIPCIDQLELYKSLTYSIEPTYKLSAIAQKHLGKDKVAYEGTLDRVYEEDLSLFVEYSGTDTDLLFELEEKLGHISLRNELKRLCSSTWKSAETTTGLIDPLVLSYAKNANIVCRDAINIKTDDKIPGAYVRDPIPGLHSWLVDFDYTSLYPSIICSLNLGPNTLVAKIDRDAAIAHIYNQTKRVKPELDITYNPLMENSQSETIEYSKFKRWMEDNRYIIASSGCIFKSHKEEISFFYKILRYLLDSRVQYKTQMKQAKAKGDSHKDEFKYYKNVQEAYKIIANSLYGVLANTGFRFFSHDLAKTITLTGQEAIKFIGYHVGHYMKNGTRNIDPYFLDDFDQKEVPYLLYTDTDSIFIQMGEYLIDQKILEL